MTSGPVLSTGRRAAFGRAGPWPAEEEEDAAGAIDARVPSVARMYNYYLGGKDNFVVDRDLAEQALGKAPIISGLVQVNRTFLRGAACLLAERLGVRQFLDIGCGLPAAVNLDDIVRRIDPACRVAYVDNDPMVLSHARALLAVTGHVAAFEADLRDPGKLLGHPRLRQLIDFDEPVAVFLMDVLHFIGDADDPRGIIDDLLASLPTGSRLVISHAERTPDLQAVSRLYEGAGIPFTPRSHQEITELTRGLELIPPYPANLLLSRSGDGTGPNAMPLIGCVGGKPR